MRLFAVSMAAALICVNGATAQDQPQYPAHRHGTQPGSHGHGHAENHDWYQKLKQPGTGYSCCNAQTAADPNGDCRPTRAYLHDDGTWRAMIDGRWIPVPPRAVLEQLAPDGNSHICASKAGMIFCFIGGSPKA
jgi:hypothetical protein